VSFRLVIHPELKAQIDLLAAAHKRYEDGERSPENELASKEFQAVMAALKSLRDGREIAVNEETRQPGQYVGKQLQYGPSSHDLRDCAEIKVPVVQEYGDRGQRLGPSHRLVYQEFEAPPKFEGGKEVPDPEALPVRYVVAFEARSNDPAGVTGERLGRARGIPERDLQHLSNSRPDVGRQRDDAQVTPHRMPHTELTRQIAILHTSPPAGTARPPADAPEAKVNRSAQPGPSRAREV
jgi:hypothetical protein